MAPKTLPSDPTVAAVVAYAAQLRHRGQRHKTADPYSNPYMPTEAAARKLANRLGPNRALAELAARSVMHDRQERDNNQAAQHARARHHRRATEAHRHRQQQRQQQTLGQRLDTALARLTTTAAAPIANLQSDRITGGNDPNAIPRTPGDLHGSAHRRALATVEWIEAQLDNAQRRRVELEQTA